MTVGERLKQWRKENNLTTNEIAKETGLSPGGLSEYENDKKLIGSKTLLTLYKFYKIDINFILTGERNDLTEEENKILLDYRRLDERRKGRLQERLCQLVEEVPKTDNLLNSKIG